MASRCGTSIDGQMKTPQYAWSIKPSFTNIDYLDQSMNKYLFPQFSVGWGYDLTPFEYIFPTIYLFIYTSTTRHHMETFSALLALCVGNSVVTGAFPTQRPETRSFGVFFDLRLNKRLSKQSRGWWFETPSRSLWRHCNAVHCWYSSKRLYTVHTLDGYENIPWVKIKKV